MAQIRRGGKIQSKLAFLIYGDKGTWKSSLALEFAKMKNEKGEPMKVLYIDTEEGSIDDYLDGLAIEGIDIDNIIVAKTKSFNETLDLVKQAKDVSATKPMRIKSQDDLGNVEIVEIINEDGSSWIPDAIVIDSLTVLYNQLVQALLDMSQRRAGQRANKQGLIGAEKALAVETAGLEIKDYQTIGHRGQELILDLMASGKHFAVIARQKEIKEQKMNSKNEFETISTGKYQPEGFKEVEYNVKTVLHTFNEDGTTYAVVEDKDRTGVKKQNEKIENPSLLDWEVIIKRNVGKKEQPIRNTVAESVQEDISAIQDKIIRETGEEIVQKSDFDQELQSLKDSIFDMIQKISSNQKRKELKDECEKYNIPAGTFQKITDKSQLQQMKEITAAFLTRNNIH